mmetsp:Transcript_37202/g.77934  ORF Transcript_37202/g.77934 Transcript_37202/m.77934 type:complete len:114 (+) Transcript_37202:2029-2370(+)
MVFLLDLCEEIIIKKSGEDCNCNRSPANEERESAYDGDDNGSDVRISRQSTKLTENDERDHIVNHGSTDDELTHRGVDDLSLSEDVHGNSQTSRTEASSSCDGTSHIGSNGQR